MATAAVQTPQPTPYFSQQLSNTTASANNIPTPKPHDVDTVLYYHKPNADGSPPHPTYVDRPETYERPTEAHPTTVHDVRGTEKQYLLDQNGFQFYKHASAEKAFADDNEIKKAYYAETEQLLKDA
jgi:hypothetical protein